jgi:hypothetical protein
MTVNWKQLVNVAEVTVLSAVAAFLGAVSEIPGGSFDAKHLAAAGVGVLTGLAWKLSGVVSAAISPTLSSSAPTRTPAPTAGTALLSPPDQTAMSGPAPLPVPPVPAAGSVAPPLG